MCSSHYGSWHRKTFGRKRSNEYFDIVCVNCGAPHRAARADGKYCSLLCRDIDRGARTVWPLPRRHPVMQILHPAPSKPAPQAQRTAQCEWCGSTFVTNKQVQRMCSTDCKIKAKRVRRRGREAGSPTFYTWSEVMRLFLVFDRCCAYCERPIDGQPDPDHVVPLSRGGSNSITNILPCCRPCNSDKRDLLLEEWAADRKRRGLPPVTTTWAIDDPRVRHLTSLAMAA